MIEYDPHRWRTMFFAVRGSMLPAITWRVSIAMIFAVAITLVHLYVMPIAIPEGGAAHGLIGAALALLLVFRTNASYDRWWEGRKLWGSVMNTSRNLARASSVHLMNDPERLTRVLRLLMAWPWSAVAALRADKPQLEGIDPRDMATLTGAYHPPTAIAARITHLLEEYRAQGQLPDIVFTSLDANCQTLVDCIGACERIHKTPLPFAYVVHLRRALVLYCATLPFALLTRFGAWACLITFLVSYVMFGIEEIGVEIEDPFEGDDNDLPLKRLSAGIAANVAAFLPSKSGAPTAVPVVDAEQ